jgi:DNA-binding IclR family transcriptional regulator
VLGQTIESGERGAWRGEYLLPKVAGTTIAGRGRRAQNLRQGARSGYCTISTGRGADLTGMAIPVLVADELPGLAVPAAGQRSEPTAERRLARLLHARHTPRKEGTSA